MSELLPDLVEEILSRVPAKSLSQLRSTCKRWDSLLKDQRFTDKHSRKAAKQFLVLMLNEYRICSLNVNLHGIRNNFNASSIESNKFGLSLNDSHYISGQVDILRVFHCDGLLLCTTKDRRLVVWNPCNGQTRWIQYSKLYKSNLFALGYENNKSCHTYKILRCWCNSDPDHRVLGFEIYEFSSDSWRVLDVNPDCIVQPNGVSLKGNAYWLGLDEKQEEEVLVSFDFSTESFRRLCLPFPSYENVTLSAVNEEQLSVLHQCYTENVDMEIWVTTNDKIDQAKVLSWIMFLAVDPVFCPPLFKRNVSFFIDEEKEVAVCCDIGGRDDETIMVYIIGEDRYRGISFGKSSKISHWPFMFNYVPSLVQIQQGTVRKRKERN